MERQYLCIDLKSFYASVECVDRGLDPMTTNLVVADPQRTDKTICLAITPAMKALGVPNRCRMFEIPPHIDYIIAPPRMKRYIDYSAEIYDIYLRYVSRDDIHVYSIDEVFIDVTNYLALYGMTARQLAVRMMEDIFRELGVRAACGIGPNLYLTKIALDITAKHAADFIGELDEESYRRTLWDHKPLTDFWRIGPGTAGRPASRRRSLPPDRATPHAGQGRPAADIPPRTGRTEAKSPPRRWQRPAGAPLRTDPPKGGPAQNRRLHRTIRWPPPPIRLPAYIATIFS